MKADHPSHIGNYEIQGVIGKGAMGEVYKAVQPELNKVVAIKILPEEFKEDRDRVERFDREAKAVALLDHPNVVHIIEQGEDDGKLFFVMEFVPGSSLADVMNLRRLSLPETLSVFKQVCRGLEAAHAEEIIHRDLNPRNILVSNDLSVAKLTDFGISRVERISREHGTLSTSEVSLGTLHYMAPEQSANMVETDHRSDVYSVGVLLYEMLTGRVPVGRFSLPSQINNDVPPEFDPIVLKCLETDPRDRYSSVTRLREAVGRLEDQLRLGLVSDLRGITASTSKIIIGGTQTLKKRKVAWGAAALLLLAGGAVAGVFLLRGGKASEGRAARVEAPAANVNDGGDPLFVDPTEQFALANRENTDGLDLENAPAAPLEELDESETTEKADAVAAEAEPDPAAPAQPSSPAPSSSSAAEDLEVIQAKIDTGLLAPALEDLDAFIADGSAPQYLPTARLMKAKVLQMQGEAEAAKAGYVEVVSRHGNASEAAEAGHQLGVLLVSEKERSRIDEARQAFARVASDHPRSIWAPLSLAAKAEAEKDAKITVTDPELEIRVPAAVVSWRTLVGSYPTHSKAQRAWLGLGEEYEDLKQFDKAAEAYTGLAQNFPGSRHDAWWKAGQIYDKKLDQKDAAREAYSQVPESSRHYRDARKRLSKL